MDATVFDIFILVLRILLIVLLYLFLFMVVRVIVRELNFASRRARASSQQPVNYVPEEAYYSGAVGPGGRLVVTEIGNATTVRPGAIFELGPVTPIGRRADNVIILNDDFVSSEHSLVAYRDGQWWLSDIASTNGTFLNGEKLNQPRVLRIGDVVGVGRVKLRLEL
jgi:pSer/pThr/pTyr-binding forkhead associated (FHA) protein